MKNIVLFCVGLVLTFAYFFISCAPDSERGHMKIIKENHINSVVDSLVEEHGEAIEFRAERGVEQVARLWRKSDGDSDAFSEFCTQQFIADTELLEATVERFDKNLESVFGYLAEMERELREPMDLDMGPMLPVDNLFLDFAPSAHLSEDFFNTRIAFYILLNFPIYSLEEKLSLGPEWSRLEWAMARLAERFSSRIPPEVSQQISQAYVRADDYIANYNIHMHRCLTPEGERLFPLGKKLITHWNLRDELKSHYASLDGLPKQQMIQTIMERIVTQEIPVDVIDNPAVDWIVGTNEVSPTAAPVSEGVDIPASVEYTPEPDTRYERLLDVFHAEQALDAFYPTMPTKMARRFERDREIPEAEVEALFTSLMTSPQIEKTARLIEARLGRKLQPFDIWYDGFKSKGSMQESDLDRIISRKYLTPTAFEKDLPNILRKLGFDRSKAEFLASKVAVDPSRGAGHAMEAGRRADKAHLRTRVPSTGMDYKGYNIAVHEFGHNVEQVFTLNNVDYTLMRGVPNNGFTEAFAFVFQARDLELLDLKDADPRQEHLKALDDLWSSYEIMGVSILDMRIWRWMYDHPKTKASELKEAVIALAKNVWNEFYAPVFGVSDQIILAIYSHIIAYGLYLPDYPLGHVIAFQIEEYLEGKRLGPEMERMCVQGRVTPGLWMERAVDEAISVEPMLKKAERALVIMDEN